MPASQPSPDRPAPDAQTTLQLLKQRHPEWVLRISPATKKVSRKCGRNNWATVCHHGSWEYRCQECRPVNLCNHRGKICRCVPAGSIAITPPHDIPTDVRRWTAGFVDGDGTMRIEPKGTVIVRITQSCESGEPETLVFIQRHYGGIIAERSFNGETRGNRRRAWTLRFHNKDAKDIIKDVSELGTFKRPQAELVLDYWKRLEADPGLLKKTDRGGIQQEVDGIEE